MINGKADKIKVKCACPEKRDQLEALFRSAFDPYVQKLGRSLTESAYDWLPKSLAAGYVWVAYRDNELLGAIAVVPEGNTWLIDQVAVPPNLQGLGIGSTLLKETEKIARTRNIKKLTLYTAKVMSDLVRLYERCGFYVTGEGRPKHNKDSHIRVYMEKPLN